MRTSTISSGDIPCWARRRAPCGRFSFSSVTRSPCYRGLCEEDTSLANLTLIRPTLPVAGLLDRRIIGCSIMSSAESGVRGHSPARPPIPRLRTRLQRIHHRALRPHQHRRRVARYRRPPRPRPTGTRVARAPGHRPYLARAPQPPRGGTQADSSRARQVLGSASRICPQRLPTTPASDPLPPPRADAPAMPCTHGWQSRWPSSICLPGSTRETRSAAGRRHRCPWPRRPRGSPPSAARACGRMPWGSKSVPWGFNSARKAGQVIKRAAADRRWGLAPARPLQVKPHRRQGRWHQAGTVRFAPHGNGQP